MTTRTCFFSVLALGASFAHANIKMFSETSNAFARHINGAGSYLYNNSGAGSNINWLDTTQVTNAGALTYATLGGYSNAVTVATPTYYRSDASYFGYAGLSGTPTGTPSAQVLGTTNFTLILDAPGTITISQFNSALTNLNGTPIVQSFLTVDGTYVHASTADGSYTIPVSAGTHTATFYASTIATFNALPNTVIGQFGADYRLEVRSVPEPGTWLALGMGSLAVVFRRRRRGSWDQ